MENIADIIRAVLEALPAVIRAFSDAGVSGWMLWVWTMVMTVGFFWGGKSLRGMKHNVADHLKKNLVEH